MSDTAAPSAGPPKQPGPEVPPVPEAHEVPEQIDRELLVVRIFNHVPHPRYEHHRLVAPTSTADAAKKVHGTGFFGRLNAKVGLKITLIVGTMWAAYLFIGLALYGLPQALKAGPSAIVLWTSSEFLQLVLLPVIIVGQNIQAKASDARAEDTYKDAEAIMHECVQLQQHLQAQDQILVETIDHVRRLAASFQGAPPAFAAEVPNAGA
jgi:hypothetical protein